MDTTPGNVKTELNTTAVEEDHLRPSVRMIDYTCTIRGPDAELAYHNTGLRYSGFLQHLQHGYSRFSCNMAEKVMKNRNSKSKGRM